MMYLKLASSIRIFYPSSFIVKVSLVFAEKERYVFPTSKVEGVDK